MKFMSTNRLLLIAVIALAAVLRLWRLGDYPIHLTNDEAAIGYNAYSILKTARDEHGVFLPVVFKSFGDWKPGLYIYLTVPTVAVFGLTEFAVRLPSALAGIFSVVLLYMLAKKLFDEKVALFSAFSLAVLPWHIHFSRGAWEANLALFLQIAGTYAFIQAFDKPRNIIISALCFAFSLWAYQTAKLASLIILTGLVLFYRREILKIGKRYLLAALTAGVVVAIPIIASLFSGKVGRVEVMSVFSYPRPEEYIEETVLKQENITKDAPLYILFHSEALNLFRGVLGRYFNYISAKFLFFEGDWSNPRHTSVDAGYLLLVNIFTFAAGLYGIVKAKASRQTGLVLFLLAFSSIPAVLTRDSAHGVRPLGMIIPISIIAGYGVALLTRLAVKKRMINVLIIFLLFAGYTYSLTVYLDAYFVQNVYYEPKEYFYGYKQAVEKVINTKNNYSRIIFSQSFDQPYIFFLFYGAAAGDKRFDPALYQKEPAFVEGVNGDVGFVEKLGKIEFRQIDWPKYRGEKNTLIIGYEKDFPESDLVSPEFDVEYIRYPNGKPALVFVHRNENI